MVSKKHIVWSLILPWAIGALALLLFPISWLMPHLSTVLAWPAIGLFMLAVFSMLVPMVLVTKDIVDSKTLESNMKVIWLLALWLVLGYFAAVAYYFIVKRKVPGTQ